MTASISPITQCSCKVMLTLLLKLGVSITTAKVTLGDFKLLPNPLEILALGIQSLHSEEVMRSQPRAWINCQTYDYDSLQDDCSPASV